MPHTQASRLGIAGGKLTVRKYEIKILLHKVIPNCTFFNFPVCNYALWAWSSENN